jgi:transcriptional regulator GlxA family with amidase domain
MSEFPRPSRIGILLLPDFPLLPYASIVEPLRGANSLSGQKLYEVASISTGAEVVAASSGTSVLVDATIRSCPPLDMLVICSGGNAASFQNRETFSWLRTLAHQGVSLGSVSVGTFVLAEAGLLSGYHCTVHWEYREAFVERFPDLMVSRNIFELDRNRFTCAGGTAALDLMCELIKRAHGQELAGSVRDWFLHGPTRTGDQAQRTPLRERLGIHHPKLLQVLSRMEEAVDIPIPRKELARAAGISARQLDRLFHLNVGQGVARYYHELRLHRAHKLLMQTELSVIDVAVACGFVSASHFSRSYKAFFGVSPRLGRKGAKG